MQLASKMRFLAAQFDALLGGDLWRRNASHANAMARRLADAISAIDGVELAHPVEANGVFATLPAAAIERLRASLPPSSPSTSGTKPRARSADVLLGHHRGGRRRPRVGPRGGAIVTLAPG